MHNLNFMFQILYYETHFIKPDELQINFFIIDFNWFYSFLININHFQIINYTQKISYTSFALFLVFTFLDSLFAITNAPLSPRSTSLQNIIGIFSTTFLISGCRVFHYSKMSLPYIFVKNALVRLPTKYTPPVVICWIMKFAIAEE